MEGFSLGTCRTCRPDLLVARFRQGIFGVKGAGVSMVRSNRQGREADFHAQFLFRQSCKLIVPAAAGSDLLLERWRAEAQQS
jgi:hypothetical protein